MIWCLIEETLKENKYFSGIWIKPWSKQVI